LSGAIPNIDFSSSYSPGFTYLTAGIVAVLNHPVALVLLMQIAEVAGLLLLWRAFAVSRLDEDTKAWMVGTYAFNPLSLWYIGVAAYQGSLVFFFWALGLALFTRAGRSGMAYGINLVMTKLLAILAWPAVLLRENRFWKGTIGIGFALIVMGLFYLRDLDFIRPWVWEASDISNGNLPFLIRSITNASLLIPGFGNFAGFLFFSLAGIAVISLFLRRRTVWIVRTRGDQLALLVVCAGLFLICSRKSLAMYYPMVLPFMVLLARSSRFPQLSYGLLAALGSTSLVAPQIWSQVLDRPFHLGRLLITGDPTPAAWLLFVLDAVTIGVMGWFVVLAYRRLWSPPEEPSTETPSGRLATTTQR
jgi:hypothetical protein